MIINLAANLIVSFSVIYDPLKDFRLNKFSLLFTLIVVAVFIIPVFYRLTILRKRKINIKDNYPGLSVIGIMSLKSEGKAYYTIALFISGLMLYMAYTTMIGRSAPRSDLSSAG